MRPCAMCGHMDLPQCWSSSPCSGDKSITKVGLLQNRHMPHSGLLLTPSPCIAKYIQPWASLANGPLPAEQTILLDYITAFQVSAFWQALKLKHATIAATILIFILIKVLTVVSTGLFTLQEMPLAGAAHLMQATTVFDASAGLPLDKIDSRAAMALYGHSEYGMSLPNGTTEQYAFQLFRPTTDLTDNVDAYNASVDVFFADGWDCETGELTYESSFASSGSSTDEFCCEITPVASYYNTTIKLPDCEIHNGHLDAPAWMWLETDTDPIYGYWGTFQRVNCSNLDPSEAKFRRYLISAAYSKGVGQNDNIMLNSSNVVCRPSYKVQPGYVTIFADGSVGRDISFTGTARQFDNITPDDLASAAWSTVAKTSIIPDIDSMTVTADNFVRSMIRLTPGFQEEMLMNNTWLAEKSRQVYQQNSAQLAGLYLLRPNSQGDTFQGQISRSQQRLIVKELPVRLMQAGAAVMLALTITMLFTMPQNVVPRPIESVASIAVILARSPGLASLLKNAGHLSVDQLKRILSGHKFLSTVTDGPDGKQFSIRVIQGSETLPPTETEKQISWAQPLVLHRLVMTLTLLLALVVLIALEALFRKAQANDGIADVDINSLQRYVWLYTPTVVLILLATTFNMVDFELEFADPYHELARTEASASASLLWDPLRKIAAQTCLHALQHARFALVASTLSVILAPLLTIAVSGLFDPRAVPRTQAVMAEPLTWFNISSDGESYNMGEAAFAIPAMILQSNMSYPQWTYDELAFPSIDLSSKSMGVTNSSTGSLLIDIPSVRGAVNCTLVPESLVTNVTVNVDCTDCLAYNISTPDGCGNMGWIWTDMIYRTGTFNVPVSGTGYFGNVKAGPGEIVRSNSDNETVLCPNYLAAYGRIEDQQIKEFNYYYCTTGFESVQTTSTIDMSLQTITGVSAVHENTSITFNPYWSPSSTGGPYFIPVNLTHADESLDDFVTAMVHGKDGVPRAQLLDPTAFTAQFTHTYRQWTAQWLNSHLRQPVATLAANTTAAATGHLPPALRATYTDPSRHRLFLSPVSTRVLQGLVAALLLCGLVVFVLVDMSRVLPKSVGSIAAVASLLAGGRLVDPHAALVPRGAEWMSDSRLDKAGVWAGLRFRMRWWSQDGQMLGESKAGKGASDLEVLETKDGAMYFRIDVVPTTTTASSGDV